MSLCHRLVTHYARFPRPTGSAATFLRSAGAFRSSTTHGQRSSLSLKQVRNLATLAPAPSSENEYNFFNFTHGRWVSPDESLILARNYRKFDIAALKRVVEDAVSRSTLSEGVRVVSMRKTREGPRHRGFSLALDNGQNVVARIPFAHYDRPLEQLGRTYTTPSPALTHVIQSEVATIAYARDVLGIPIPRVLAWSADPSTTPVQSEYIVMEAASGVPLEDVWPEMNQAEKLGLVKAWMDVQGKMTAKLSGGYGSIYFREHVDPASAVEFTTDGRHDVRFVLGPSTDSRFWNAERQYLDVDRGPCEYT